MITVTGSFLTMGTLLFNLQPSSYLKFGQLLFGQVHQFSQLLRLRQPILFMEYFLILPFYLFSLLPLPPPCNPLSSSFSPLLPFLSLLCETHFYNIFYYVLTSPGIHRLKIRAGFCLSLTVTQFGLMCTYAHNGKSSYTHRGFVEFYRYRA